MSDRPCFSTKAFWATLLLSCCACSGLFCLVISNTGWGSALLASTSAPTRLLFPLLLLLLLSHFSRVRLCATPQTAAHQAPPPLGFSRREHWRGSPFPSPMQGSEKWKWNCSVVSDCYRPHGLQPTRLLNPRDFPGKSTGVGCHCLLRLLPLPSPKSFCLTFSFHVFSCSWVTLKLQLSSSREGKKEG